MEKVKHVGVRTNSHSSQSGLYSMFFLSYSTQMLVSIKKTCKSDKYPTIIIWKKQCGSSVLKIKISQQEMTQAS